VSSDFRATAKSDPAGVTVGFTGDLNAESAHSALEVIQGIELRPGQHLVVNLAALRFCDSSGISTLITAHKLAMAAQAEMVLAAVPQQLSRSLAMIGLGDHFTVYATVAEAHAASAGR
jgi:anti-sigma B factor antagonist